MAVPELKARELRRASRWPAIVVVCVWCGLIIGTSSTVVLPHDFFAWFSAHIFRDATTHRGFVVFWGYSWFAIVKGWHAAEFAILCALALTIFNRLAPSRPRRNVVAAMILCLLFALSDEYHQTFVPGRRGSWADVAIDGLGVGLAGTFAWACARRRASGVSRVP